MTKLDWDTISERRRKLEVRSTEIFHRYGIQMQVYNKILGKAFKSV